MFSTQSSQPSPTTLQWTILCWTLLSWKRNEVDSRFFFSLKLKCFHPLVQIGIQQSHELGEISDLRGSQFKKKYGKSNSKKYEILRTCIPMRQENYDLNPHTNNSDCCFSNFVFHYKSCSCHKLWLNSIMSMLSHNPLNHIYGIKN